MRRSNDSPVLILTGPPGVGKTTTAALLAEHNGPAVHLESDVFFRFIRHGYVEPWCPESHEQNRAVMGIVSQAAAAYAEAGYFTIVDGIVIPHWFLAPIRDALHAAGHPVAYVVLRAPLAVCAARLQAREGTPSVEPSAIEQIWSQFAHLGEHERHVLDVGDLTPVEAAEAIQHLLAAGSHTV